MKTLVAFSVSLLLLAYSSHCFKTVHSRPDNEDAWRGLARLAKETVELIGAPGDGDEDVTVMRNGTTWMDSLLPKNCGLRPRNFTSRLNNGYAAARGEFPSAVYVKNSYDREWGSEEYPETIRQERHCNGALISDRHVLTNAICFWENKPLDAFVSTGLSREDVDKAENRYEIDKLCVSKTFLELARDPSKILTHDIAIIRLKKPVKFNENIQPACLPKQPIKGKSGMKAVAFGEDSTQKLAKTLQVLPVKLTTCYYKEDEHFTKVCMDSENPKNKGTMCGGDGGGPIYGLEDGRQVVRALMMASNRITLECLGAYQFVATDVHKTMDELASLMKECA